EKLMSTSFAPLTVLRVTDLLDGRLEKAGVREHHSEKTTSSVKVLTDGRNFLWVYCDDDDGPVSRFARYGTNVPDRILPANSNEVAVDIGSEYEPQFWGFETQEEWDAAWRKMNEKAEQDLFNEVVKFVRGEEHEIGSGTNGMIIAEIA